MYNHEKELCIRLVVYKDLSRDFSSDLTPFSMNVPYYSRRVQILRMRDHLGDEE